MPYQSAMPRPSTLIAVATPLGWAAVAFSVLILLVFATIRLLDIAATLFFGAIFLFSLAKAFRHIWRKEVGLHREWMIRVFALAMGVASIRVFIGLFQAFGNLSMEAVFGTTFWLGFGVNLVAAEVWINVTRHKTTGPATARPRGFGAPPRLQEDK